MDNLLPNEKLANLVWSSNMIEGIEFTLEQTLVAIKDGIGPAKILDHALAYTSAAESALVGIRPTMDQISQLHGVLMHDQLSILEAGHVRKKYVRIGSEFETVFEPPLPLYLPAWGRYWDHKIETEFPSKEPEDACNLHYLLEHIHPYIDGNGRIGRVVWAWDLWSGGHKVTDMMVSPWCREAYYASLQEFHKGPVYSEFTDWFRDNPYK